MTVKVHKPNINFRKSPLSGVHITDADMRRRRYSDKCERMSFLSDLLNDEARSLEIELWDTRPSFETRGATLVCHWFGVLQQDLLLCDRTLARIQNVIDNDVVFNHEDTRAYLENHRLHELLAARVRSMREQVIWESLYGQKCG